MKHRPSRFLRNGNCAFVVAGDVISMRLTSLDLFMGGLFPVHDVRFHPDRPVRLRNPQLPWSSVEPHPSPVRVRIVDKATPHGLRLRPVVSNAPEIRPPEVVGGGVRDTRNPMAMRWSPSGWYKIEVVNGPVTGNVLSVTLGCHLSGHAEAWFDEIAFEKI